MIVPAGSRVQTIAYGKLRQPMENVKDLAQIVYYIALSIAGPLALIEYFKSKKRDRQEKEYNTYHELDNRLFDYQKLALEHYDLDILDVPNNEPSLAFDKKRKQEMVAYSILFSLFQRAFLMFRDQAEIFKEKQWSGWKLYLDVIIRRENVRAAWQLSKSTYDTEFQAFMDAKVASSMPKVSGAVVPKVTSETIAEALEPDPVHSI